MSFDEILDLTADVFSFYNTIAVDLQLKLNTQRALSGITIDLVLPGVYAVLLY